MTKYYYVKKTPKSVRKWLVALSLGIFLFGITTTLYVFSPLIFWEIYFTRSSSQDITTPIPKTSMVSSDTIKSLIEQAKNSVLGVDYSNADNWFPTFHPSTTKKPEVSLYTLSIPKINLKAARVSTINTDLGNNLVNYPGTSIPAEPGNAVIFGHSTLPYFYNSKDYKTVFTNIFKLKIGDKIYTTVKNKTYLFKIYDINVVSPSDESIFSQDYDNSYLTLVTCAPPGTIWKRLIIKAKLEKKDNYARL